MGRSRDRFWLGRIRKRLRIFLELSGNTQTKDLDQDRDCRNELRCSSPPPTDVAKSVNDCWLAARRGRDIDLMQLRRRKAEREPERWMAFFSMSFSHGWRVRGEDQGRNVLKGKP